MISPDGILLFGELKAFDDYMESELLRERLGARLEGTLEQAVDNLKSLGLVEELHIARAKHSYTVAKKATSSPKLNEDLTNTYTYFKLNVAVAIRSCRMKAPPDPAMVLRTLRKAIAPKNFNARYREVVQGKRARRDPIVEAGKRLNPQDRADYWRAIGKMDDDERDAYRDRLTQPAAHSG